MQFGDDPRLFDLLIKLAVEMAGGCELGKSARKLIDEDNSELPSIRKNCETLLCKCSYGPVIPVKINTIYRGYFWKCACQVIEQDCTC